MKKIIVLDFGGQFAYLIATKIRSLGAYSEIWPNDISAEKFDNKEVAGIIFSGGPASVYQNDAPSIDPAILDLRIPILAICYGHHLITHLLGGEVKPAKIREFGRANFKVKKSLGIFKNFPQNSIMWMSHGDEVVRYPEGFERVGVTDDGSVAALANISKNIFTVQFHPEVSHSDRGLDLLHNFIELCGVGNTWKLDNWIENTCESIREQVGAKNVFLMVSGGVDSSVCFALLEKSLGKERVFGMFVDTGLMRMNEAQKVKELLASAGFTDLHIINEKQRFLNALKGIVDPEIKRRIIGNAFLDAQQATVEKLDLNPQEWFLAQGTIYPDTIESGGTKNADKIKTHHNRVPRIEELIKQGKIIEPIKDLFKDEVREIGLKLGLPKKVVARRPFPGPGLGVRILCADHPDELNNADQLQILILKKYGFANKILPIKSVGVQGDARTYAHPLVLFLDIFNDSHIRKLLSMINLDEFREYDPQKTLKLTLSDERKIFALLENIATEIPNQFREINRVLFCLNSQQIDSGTISFLPNFITEKRVILLQKIDALVENILDSLSVKDQGHIWQFPVVLSPVGFQGGESIILRPIESENAMTAKAAYLPFKTMKIMSEEILSHHQEITAVFFDLTSKPPGTIEWE